MTHWIQGRPPISRKRLSMPSRRLLPPAMISPVTSSHLPQRNKKGGWAGPPPFESAPTLTGQFGSSFLLQHRPFGGPPAEDPPFRNDHPHRHQDRIHLGFNGNRRLQDGVVESGHRHLQPGIAVMAVPCEEDGRNVLARFKLDIFILVISLEGSLHEDGPPPLFELTLDQFQVPGGPHTVIERLVPAGAGIGRQ